MVFFIGIKTYNRIEYLKKLIDSIKQTVSDHKYIICIHDDGSKDGSRKYIKGLKNTDQIKWRTLFSANVGAHDSTNKLFSISENFDYDLGFLLDDDIYFTKTGWETLYFNAVIKSGFGHLSHYSTDWNPSYFNKKKKGLLQAHTDVWNSQGTFFTFTKKLLSEIGTIDSENFGRRGEGHRDWSLRACRVNQNEKKTFWDAKDAHNYIKLHLKENYITTPGYSEEVAIAQKEGRQKVLLMKDNNRKYIPNNFSQINTYFDHVYLLNLKRRPDRLSKMQELLTRLNISFELIEAIDGKAENLKGNLDAGILGCHFSHLKILKDIKAKGYERPLILEDDLIAHKNFDSVMQNLWEIPEDWKMLYLGSADWNFKNNKKFIKADKKYYRGFKIDSTFAYSVSCDIIDELIYLFEKPISKPCDTSLHEIHEKHKAYIMLPQPFIADVTDSDLREPRNLKTYCDKVNWNLEDYE